MDIVILPYHFTLLIEMAIWDPCAGFAGIDLYHWLRK